MKAKDETKVKTLKIKATSERGIKNPKAKKEETKTVTLPKAKVEKKKAELVEIITTTNNAALVEKVISNREVKYQYPEDCEDTLSRKAFRQKVRNKIHQMERELFKISDRDSKEYKAKARELRVFQKQYIKKDVAV